IVLVASALTAWLMPSPAHAQDWTPTTTDLLRTEKPGFGGLCGIVVDHRTGHVIVNLSDRGFYRSEDQGKSWKRLHDKAIKVGTAYGPAWIFDDKTAVVAEAKTKTNARPGLVRTSKTFQPCGNYYARALPRWRDGKLYWLVEGAFLLTADRGETWTKLSDVKD